MFNTSTFWPSKIGPFWNPINGHNSYCKLFPQNHAWLIVTLPQLPGHQVWGRATEADALAEQNGAAQILPTGLTANGSPNAWRRTLFNKPVEKRLNTELNEICWTLTWTKFSFAIFWFPIFLFFILVLHFLLMVPLNCWLLKCCLHPPFDHPELQTDSFSSWNRITERSGSSGKSLVGMILWLPDRLNLQSTDRSVQSSERTHVVILRMTHLIFAIQISELLVVSVWWILMVIHIVACAWQGTLREDRLLQVEVHGTRQFAQQLEQLHHVGLASSKFHQHLVAPMIVLFVL